MTHAHGCQQQPILDRAINNIIILLTFRSAGRITCIAILLPQSHEYNLQISTRLTMKSHMLLAIILKVSLQLGKINSVSASLFSDSAVDGLSDASPLQRRRNSRNVIQCKPTDRAPFGGILQDCLICVAQMSKHHLPCAMLKTCAVVVVDPKTSKQSKIEKMSVEELVYRLPQSLDPSCSVEPRLKFVNKTFAPTPDSTKAIGIIFFDEPLKAPKVQVCDKQTLEKFGYVKF